MKRISKCQLWKLLKGYWASETMLDPGESDHPLAAVGVVAQTPRDVAANFYLHTRLAEVDVAVTAQLKAHRVLHNPMKPL